MSDKDFDTVDVKKIQEIFRRANSSSQEGPSPYLKTRVLARLREKKSRRQVHVWKWVAALGSAFSIALAVMVFGFSDASFSARIGQPVLVKVELQNVQTSGVAYAEIVLPEGVHFYSSQFPEMRERRSLTLEWDQGFAAGKLPFVIQSDEARSGEVLVLLKDQNHVVTGQKKIRIEFKG